MRCGAHAAIDHDVVVVVAFGGGGGGIGLRLRLDLDVAPGRDIHARGPIHPPHLSPQASRDLLRQVHRVGGRYLEATTWRRAIIVHRMMISMNIMMIISTTTTMTTTMTITDRVVVPSARAAGSRRRRRRRRVVVVVVVVGSPRVQDWFGKETRVVVHIGVRMQVPSSSVVMIGDRLLFLFAPVRGGGEQRQRVVAQRRRCPG